MAGSTASAGLEEFELATPSTSVLRRNREPTATECSLGDLKSISLIGRQVEKFTIAFALRRGVVILRESSTSSTRIKPRPTNPRLQIKQRRRVHRLAQHFLPLRSLLIRQVSA